MWSRRFLKTRAKEVLRISYWKAFLVSLIIAFVGGSSRGMSFNFNWNLGDARTRDIPNPFIRNSELFPTLFIIIMLIVMIVILFIIAFRILLGYALEVGGRRYFIQAAQNNINMGFLGFAFERGRYFDIVKTMLWRGLLNFLWYLLFIIPGTVKSYAYSMVPYILADNPNIGYKRAVELSKKMTDDQKFSIFVLDLSFIGWYMLGTLALLVGVLFVIPYENSTKAELYIVLRQNALDSEICSYEELMLNSPWSVDTEQA